MMDIWLTIFLTFVVSHKVQSQLRLVVNTTCLELARPSNQKFRISCRQYDYHCLLDETFTKEFEVCREWKWIPEGKCAYFNTYENGNIDGRPCISSGLFCPNVQYSSADTTIYSTCYMKNTYTIDLTTSSHKRRSTSYPFSETTDKKSNRTCMDIHIYVYITIAFGVIILSLSNTVMCIKYRRVIIGKKGTHTSDENEDQNAERHLLVNARNGSLENLNDGKTGTEMSDEKCDNQTAERHSLINAGNDKLEDRANMISQSENNSTAVDSKDENKVQEKSAGMPLDQQKLENEDVYKEECEESSGHKPQQTVIIHDKKQDDKKPKGMVESLQRITPPTDERDKKLFRDLYNLLSLEGPKLSQKVMEAIITRITGKSIQELVADETVKTTLAENIPEEFCHSDNNQKCQNLFIISYSLLRIYLDEKYHPKSGWGNPVIEKDICIGDDLERLYNIHSVACGISEPDTVSVESYIRLLDTMMEALSRLDPDADLRALAKEITIIKRITQI